MAPATRPAMPATSPLLRLASAAAIRLRPHPRSGWRWKGFRRWHRGLRHEAIRRDWCDVVQRDSHLVPGLKMPAMASGLLRNFQAILFPGFEAAVHFHDGITLRGELHRGVRAHVTVLCIAVNDVHRVRAQTGERAPFFLRQIDRAGDVAFLKIFGLAHVYDDDILFFLNQVAYLDGAGGESHLVREELFRLRRVALECFSHNDFR